MSAARWALIVVGLFLLLFGIVFALQGANVLKGSAIMSGNSTYIYVGVILGIIGLILVLAGVRTGHNPSSALTSGRATRSGPTGRSA